MRIPTPEEAEEDFLRDLYISHQRHGLLETNYPRGKRLPTRVQTAIDRGYATIGYRPAGPSLTPTLFEFVNVYLTETGVMICRLKGFDQPNENKPSFL